MAFKDDILTDLEAVFFDEDEGAFEAYDVDGEGDILLLEVAQDPALMDQEAAANTMTVLCLVSDIAEPQADREILIGGDTWYVNRNLGGGSRVGTWMLELSRSKRRGMR